MDISIIIVNWNTRALLLECIRALISQEGEFQMEVIVVDNGSADGSQEAVRTTFQDVQLIENKANLGFGKANNIGIAKSSGRYVCVVNSDVKVMDNCIQGLMTFMDTHTDIGVSGPKLLYPDLTEQDSCRRFPSLWNNLSPVLGLDKIFKDFPLFSGEQMAYFNHNEVFFPDYLAGCLLMVRRKALEEVGLFDERFFIYQEEVDWCKRFKQNGWKIAFYPEVSAVHCHGASSSKEPTRFALEHQKSLLKYWKKHYSPVSVIAMRLIIFLNHGLRIIPRAALYCVRYSQRDEIAQKLKVHFTCISALLQEVKQEKDTHSYL